MTTMTDSIGKTNLQSETPSEQFRSETQRLLSNRALHQKMLRLLYSDRLLQMRDRDGGDYEPIVKIELSGDQFLGYRDRNEVPWNGIFSDHVLIGDEKFYLNAKQSAKLADPAVELLDLATALNSMMDFRTGSVFIACSLYDGEDDFFLVRHFQTDGSSLSAIAAHDGTCHDIVQGCGWVYDLRHRRFVYGQGGPLRDGVQ